MTVHPNIHRAEKALKDGGGFYDLPDLLSAIEAGTMQSFSHGESWAVTQLQVYPRKRVCEIVLVVGDTKDLPPLEQQVIQFAREQQCDMVRAIGRFGWHRKRTAGWNTTNAVYARGI